MKKILILFSVTLLVSFVGLLFFECDNSNQETSQKEIWSQRADSAYSSLFQLYWSNDLNRGYKNELKEEDLNYWWQAHLLDALVDYQVRKGTKDMSLVDRHIQGVIKGNKGTILIDFYDDMEWMALALIRAYKHTNDLKYLNYAKELWTDIKTGWNSNHGGGIAWQKSQLDYKNTPANAPAAIIGYYLYQIQKNEADKQMADKIMQWLDSHLVSDSGRIADGMGREGGTKIDDAWQFTYNYGIYIGACLEAYKITKERKYLDKAILSANYAIKTLVQPSTNILKSEGQGDGGLFKGILFRYLYDLAMEKDLDTQLQNKYLDFIKANALSLWSKAKTSTYPFRFSSDWTKMEDKYTDLSTQLSAVIVLDLVSK
jgi:predicted alpha-1,6-mannanase (GH76 family)